MKTAEIVKALPGNKVVKMIVPEWACCSIPYPFYRNGNPCLGFYYYPMKNDGEHHKIQAPIIQIVTSYPEGRIVSMVASPFFLMKNMSSVGTIGEYPGKKLAGMSYVESNAVYQSYYASCDAFFNAKNTEAWKKEYEVVCEEGMNEFLELFGDATSPVLYSAKGQRPLAQTSKTATETSEFIISLKTKRFLRELKKFFAEKIFSQEATDLQKAMNDVTGGEFTIAAIGEFSRGKTTFLNELLGRDILPVGDLPTTAILTKISHAEEESLFYIDRSGSSRQFPCVKESFESFLADGDGNDPNGVLQVYLPMPWLNHQKIRFFDTPGTGDAIGQRGNIVREVITGCDCIVMAISAQSPCSMTEIEFLKETVLLKSVPRCVILITKLDTIPEAERGGLISFVKQKISSIVPMTKYWISHEMAGIEKGAVDAIGIPMIRECINRMLISDAELLKEREMRMLFRVGRILEQSTKEIDIVAQTEKMDFDQKQKIVQKLIQNKNSLDTSWNLLSEKCQARQFEAEKMIQKQLSDAKETLLKDWSISLQRASSPKDWVERDFPYMAEKNVKALHDNFTRKIASLVMQDRIYLANEAKQYLAVNGLNIMLPEYDYTPMPEGFETETKNFEKLRTYTRIATIAAPVLLMPVLGIPYTLISGGAGLVADFFLKNKIAEQKKMLEEKLEAKASEIFATTESQLHDYLIKCYNELLSSLKADADKVLSGALVKIQEAQTVISGADTLRSVALKKQLVTFQKQLAVLTK